MDMDPFSWTRKAPWSNVSQIQSICLSLCVNCVALLTFKWPAVANANLTVG